MAINDSSSKVKLNEEKIVCALDKILLFPQIDADIEAITSLPVEEVNAQLIKIGLDPTAPLPARIVDLIPEKEARGGSPSVRSNLRIVKTDAAKAGFSFGNSYLQTGQLRLRSAWCYTLAFMYVFYLVSFLLDVPPRHENQSVPDRSATSPEAGKVKSTTSNVDDPVNLGGHISPAKPSGYVSINSNSRKTKISNNKFAGKKKESGNIAQNRGDENHKTSADTTNHSISTPSIDKIEGPHSGGRTGRDPNCRYGPPPDPNYC